MAQGKIDFHCFEVFSRVFSFYYEQGNNDILEQKKLWKGKLQIL